MVTNIHELFQDAIVQRDDKTVRELAKRRDFKSNFKTGGMHLIHYAVTSDHHGAVVALADNVLTNLNQRDNCGMTALHMAWDKPKIALYLLERQADPSIADEKGYTALHKIVQSKKEWRQEVIQNILRHPNTNIFAKTETGETVYDLATSENKKLLEQDKRISRWLSKQGVKIETEKQKVSKTKEPKLSESIKLEECENSAEMAQLYLKGGLSGGLSGVFGEAASSQPKELHYSRPSNFGKDSRYKDGYHDVVKVEQDAKKRSNWGGK